MSKSHILALLLILAAPVFGAAGQKKVIYKSHTQIDFTGEKVEGKVKAPAVFYIFQRKRAQGHEAASVPASLSFHDAPMKRIFQDSTK